MGVLRDTARAPQPPINRASNEPANLAPFGPKLLIFTGASKSFGNHTMEKPPRQLVRIVIWSAWEQMGQKC